MYVTVDNDTGLAVPEGKINQTIDRLIDDLARGQTVEPIGQNELVAGLRLAVKQGKLSGLTFVFGGWEFPVNRSGTMSEWPRNFPGDVNDSLLMELLQIRTINKVTP